MTFCPTKGHMRDESEKRGISLYLHLTLYPIDTMQNISKANEMTAA